VKRLVLAAVLVGALALTGCGSSSSSSSAPSTNATASGGTAPGTVPGTTVGTTRVPGSTPPGSTVKGTGPFCAQLQKVDDQSKANKAAGGTTTPAEMNAFVAELGTLGSLAPSELQAPIKTLAQTLLRLAALGDSQEDAAEAITIVTSPDVQDASAAVESAGKSLCGIDINITGGSTGPTSSSTVPGGAAGTGAGYDCSKITSSFESQKSDPTSIYAVKLGMCTAAPSGTWGSAVFSGAGWTSSGSDPASWQVVVYTDGTVAPNFTADDAVAVCRSMATYLGSVGSGASEISIGTGASSGSFDSATVLASKSATGSCTAT
jgi:hypothetical protein